MIYPRIEKTKLEVESELYIITSINLYCVIPYREYYRDEQ